MGASTQVTVLGPLPDLGFSTTAGQQHGGGVVNTLSIISLLKWFTGDDLVIDNAFFKLHHQASTLIIMFGLLFIFLENHLDGRAIVCQGGDQYARYEKQTNAYAWEPGKPQIRDWLDWFGLGGRALC